MAITRTSNLKLAKPAPSDRNWGGPLNDNLDRLDAIAALGALAVSPREVPSASLWVKVAPGSYQKADGSIGVYAGVAQDNAANNATTRFWLTDAGVLGKGAAWPSSPHVRLASVTAVDSKITAIVDERVVCRTAKPAPSLPAATAGTTFGTNERTMLQAVYDAVRNLGSGV